MLLCPKCGNPYAGGVKFCPCCGADLGTGHVSNVTRIQLDDIPSEADDLSNGFATNVSAPAHVQASKNPAVSSAISDAPIPSQPIWIKRAKEEPIEDLSEETLDSLLYNPDEPADEADAKTPDYLAHSETSYDPNQGDIFDEVADISSTLFSNMSPKMKKFIIITIIGTILSAIPFLYLSCTHQSIMPSFGGVIPTAVTSGLLP